MFTPDGQSAAKTDKIMLLAMWAKTLSKERNGTSCAPVISAGMGKPTFSINEYTVQSQLSYWGNLNKRLSSEKNGQTNDIPSTAIDYGDPRGEAYARETMAFAMAKWYEAPIYSGNILFTVGGAGALRIIFETLNLLNKDFPAYRVITPFPHYTLYADNRHILHPIHVMTEPGYRLTARSVQASIEKAYILAEMDGALPKVLLLCNPNNPLGTIIEEEELEKIAELLRIYPDLHIVLDEAYAEMCFDMKKVPSLLAIAPDLKNRIIVVRSATKALSAAGERMAILIAFDDDFMGKLLDKNISTVGHAPISSQIAYAETMAHFNDRDHEQLIKFYRKKVDYVSDRLKGMGAAMPDTEYKVTGTFYIVGDFSDLLGIELPDEAARALGKHGKVTTSEALAYFLLFQDSIAIAPLSYCGISRKNGFMRITCSASDEELNELMNRLQLRLFETRHKRKIKLIDELAPKFLKLHDLNKVKHDEIIIAFIESLSVEETCLNLKETNRILKDLNLQADLYINKKSDACQIQAAITSGSRLRVF